MKRNISFLLIPLVGILFVLFSGCYTQLKTMREESADNGDYNYSTASGDTAYMANGDSMQGSNPEYDNGGGDGYYHPQVGFDYYYPSYGVGYSYGNPWLSDYYWGYNYYPWYCGTAFIGYPWYGYGYLPGAYYYGGHYYSNNGHGRYAYGVTRTPTLGRLTRESQIEAGRGATQINTNGYNLPRAARLATPLAGPSPVRTKTGTTTGRSAGVRNGSNRVYSNRNAAQRYYRLPNAPSQSPPKGSSGRSSDRSYRVSGAPSAPQHSSAPRVSGGGGGSRGSGGGGSRGGGGGSRGGHR